MLGGIGGRRRRGWQRMRWLDGITDLSHIVKLSLFADDMILYIENPKDSTRKLLELINEYSSCRI